MEIIKSEGEYGSFELRVSEKLEAQLHRLAKKILTSIEQDPAKIDEAKVLEAMTLDAAFIAACIDLLLRSLELASKGSLLGPTIRDIMRFLIPLKEKLKKEDQIRQEKVSRNN